MSKTMIQTPVKYLERGIFDSTDSMILHMFPHPTVEDAEGEYIATCINDHTRLVTENAELKAEVKRLRGLINTPHTDEWIEAVKLEAAHQIERWGTQNDEGKSPTDWFWLLGYLGGKAVWAATHGDAEKAKHHTISSGAVLLNWFRYMVGDDASFRPGISNEAQAALEAEQ